MMRLRSKIIRYVGIGLACLVLVSAVVGVSGALGVIVNRAFAANTADPTITVTGATTMKQLGATEIENYMAKHQVIATWLPSDSGTGIKDAAKDLVNVGASDVFLSPGQYKGLVNIPTWVAGQAIDINLPGVQVLPKHPGVKPVIHLNGTVLAAMYSGRITMWNDPRVQALNRFLVLPAVQVRPFERTDSSGSTFAFSSYLQSQSDTGWPQPSETVSWFHLTNAVGESGSDAMLEGCEKTVGCVAYIGVTEDGIAVSHGLSIAAVANGSGQFVLPSQASMAMAAAQTAAAMPANGSQTVIDSLKGYPLTNYEYLVVKTQQGSATLAAALRTFLSWLLTTGSSPGNLSGVSFVALPAHPRTVAMALISQIQQ